MEGGLTLSALEQLNQRLVAYIDLSHVQSLLNWDLQVYMPTEGAEERGEQSATIRRLAHEVLLSDETARLLEEAKSQAASLDADSDEAAMVRVIDRAYTKERNVPADWVSRFSRVTSLAYDTWVKAKSRSDFALFRPHLEEVVRLRQEYASFFKPYEHGYDPLLDDFEPGMKTAEVQAIFRSIRPAQVALIQAIGQAQPVDDACLHQAFDPAAQREFSLELSQRLGFDFSRGRLDISPHPFTTSFGQGDVRITTHFAPAYLGMSLFSTIHETGHALYDQGIPLAYRRTMLADGASMAIHESQSRLYENLVGRSRPFWTYFYPRLQQRFPTQLAGVPLETFYRAINQVKPSLIRIEADEATYNLHIMLRLELEIALIEGSLAVKDLPEAWNDQMQANLGLTPPDDAQGVLQDVHWSSGDIGYFATYALGNLVAAQLWEKINADLPDLAQQFERGEFGALLEWLRQHVHRFGARYLPKTLIQRATGTSIDPAPYLRYLNEKYGEIYRL